MSVNGSQHSINASVMKRKPQLQCGDEALKMCGLCKSTHFLAHYLCVIYRSTEAGYTWAIRKSNILVCHDKVIKNDKVPKKNSSGAEKRQERQNYHLVRGPGGLPHPCYYAGCQLLPCVWMLPDAATSFPQLLFFLYGANFAMSVHEGHEDRHGRKVCNLYHPWSNHLGLLPRLSCAMSHHQPLLRTQHPNEGQPQLLSTQDKNVKWPFVELTGRTKAPPATGLLVPHRLLLRFENLNSWWCISCFGRNTSEGTSCLFICLTKQLLIIIWRQHPIATPACTQWTELRKKFMAE